MKKSQTTTTNISLLLLCIEKLIFCWKHILKNFVYIVTFVLQFFHVTGYWKCVNKTSTSMQICTGFVVAALRPNIVRNRLGITRILIAMNYYIFFYLFQRSTFNLEKNKSICWRTFFVQPIQVTWSTYCGIVFQAMYTSKICT